MAGRDVGSREAVTQPARLPGVGVLAALQGAGLILWNIVAMPLIGQKRLRWGTIAGEASAVLPGDDLIADPKWSYTLGVSIDAPARAVWPWIAQIGQGRGGFYTYQTLENLVGCRVANTAEIIEEHQHPAVGDGIHLHPDTPPLQIAIVDPPHTFVLWGSPAAIGEGAGWGKSTWQFVITSATDEGCRLLTRGRYDYAPDWKSRLTFGRFPIEPISYVMSRRMMLEIKRLAEQLAQQP